MLIDEPLYPSEMEFWMHHMAPSSVQSLDVDLMAQFKDGGRLRKRRVLL